MTYYTYRSSMDNVYYAHTCADTVDIDASSMHGSYGCIQIYLYCSEVSDWFMLINA